MPSTCDIVTFNQGNRGEMPSTTSYALIPSSIKSDAPLETNQPPKGPGKQPHQSKYESDNARRKTTHFKVISTPVYWYCNSVESGSYDHRKRQVWITLIWGWLARQPSLFPRESGFKNRLIVPSSLYVREKLAARKACTHSSLFWYFSRHAGQLKI